MRSQSGKTTLLSLTVPELRRRPLVGGGCCAVPSAWLIEETLAQLTGVERVHADDEQGRILLKLRPGGVKMEEILEALQALGFPPASEQAV